jgi:hypothetical protein
MPFAILLGKHQTSYRDCSAVEGETRSGQSKLLTRTMDLTQDSVERGS